MPRFDRTVTLGNVISWLVLLIGFVTGYSQMQGDVNRSKDDIKDIKTAEVAATTKMNIMSENVAVIRATVDEMNKKLDRPTGQRAPLFP